MTDPAGGPAHEGGPAGRDNPVLRVAIAEDALLLREGLVRVLREAGFEVVGAAGDAAGLLATVARTRPDVVVVDIRMPPTHTDEGLRAAAAIRARDASIGILVLSQFVEVEYAYRLIEGEARGLGYLLKDRLSRIDELTDAIRRVAGGGTAIDPSLVAQLLRRRRQRDPLDSLTEREREVLGLMAEGRSNAAIAARLVVVEKTVDTHIANIFSKLGLEPQPEDHRRVLAVLSYLRAS
ncbi:MAG TPA: response regulator transcription factor [Candidatus Limnocylindrales bacterium]|nr:response regulator transcription factor [Candidatus Limnocylindrales bacterium]